MSDNVENLYPDQYKKIKNLGYDTVEIRNLRANLDLDYHLHPFTACMYIISGEVKIEDLSKKEYHLKAGDFIAVDSNDMHNEKTFEQGAKVIYGKKFDKDRINNLDVVDSSLNSLYLGNNDKFISYITKTPVSYIVYLTLYKQYYSEKWHSQEEIINLVPRVYGSRSTIINLIKEGIVAGYIIKRNTSEDRRSVYYELDMDIYKSIDQWVINRKTSFKEMIKKNK
tara:strand:- start:1803 stop:2477 length:675 start_codon:yes stop_codon:yes gene_type:complete